MPFLLFLDDAPTAYLATYTATQAPLVSHPAIASTDRGVHFLIGDSGYVGRGLGQRILTRVADMLFDTHKDMGQFMAEPAVSNTVVQRIAAKLGLSEVGHVDLNYKVARLLTIGRGEWASLRNDEGERPTVIVPFLQ